MAHQSQNVDPGLHQLLLPGEARLPLKDLSNEDITLLANFIATHRNQITLRPSLYLTASQQYSIHEYC